VAQELKESEDPIVSTIGSILGGLSDALHWLTKDNAENAKTALLILAGVWTGGKVLQMVSTIGTLAGNIATIKAAGGLNFLSSVFSGGGAGGLGGLAGAGAANLGSTITSAVTSCAGPIASAIAGVTMSVGLIAIAVPLIDTIAKMIRGEDPLGLNKDVEKPGDFMENASEEVKELADEIDEKTPTGLKWKGWNRPLRDTLTQAGLVTQMEMQEEGRYAGMTEAQRQAAEDYYDALRNQYPMGDDSGRLLELYTKLDDLLGDENVLLDLTAAIDEMMRQNTLNDLDNPADLPADWWKKGSDENGVTSEDIQSLNALPGAVKAAVQEVAGSIVFKIDGEQVAWLVAPRVSQFIARDIEP
jgi:hypothetical protein